MITFLFILAADAGPIGGAAAGGASGLGLLTWLVKRHFKKRDERRREAEEREARRDAKIDSLVECGHRTATGLAVLQTKVDEGFKAGDDRMRRIEAAQDNTQRDVRQIRADVTTIKRKTGRQTEREASASDTNELDA